MRNDERIYSFSIFKKNVAALFKSIISKIKKMGRLKKRGALHSITKNLLLVGLVMFLFVSGGTILWLSTLKIPELESFDRRLLAESTKIYDRTGEVLLYNVNQDIKRTVVPFDQVSDYMKYATIAIEDSGFYNHRGIQPTSIIRAILVNLRSREYAQGGSTITQQVIKNALLTNDKKISRKIKEWVLALKLERQMDKDSILSLYLNGIPYGGPIYGVEEASQSFFGKPARDLTLVESAYLASLPQAPTYYSPFGRNTDKLVERKNRVLKEMLDEEFITKEEYEAARTQEVVFKTPESRSLKAPHFVNHILEYLEEKYGEEAIQHGGLKVTTTLDYELQEKAEEIVKRYALENKKNFNAENAALVAVDPKTGGILVMVGSRDYFDKEIQGNFNVTTAHRQPGSAFKPFVYAAAFNKGYTSETVLFDVETEFSTACRPDLPVTGSECYRPQNYDNNFRGPMTIRKALAQSINIPAVKALYLVGVNNAIKIAKDMGINGLGTASQYGLTLVLGGGEVSPLDITSAYGVFANDGIKNPTVSILKIEDPNGNVLEEFKEKPVRVLPEQSARQISDILSDRSARSPNPHFDFSGDNVAMKTGTTNDYRDAWTVGYTPNIAVGAWVGNNNNSAMEKRVAGFIVAPLWRAFMDEALKKIPSDSFIHPDPIDPNLKPILRGIWQGGTAYTIDRRTNLPATNETPFEDRQEVIIPGNIHSILYWVDKDNPLGPPPSNPYADPQFRLWEYGVQRWLQGYLPPQPNGKNPENPQPQLIEEPEPIFNQ